MKKISVIVPVYNVEAYLKRCLDSIIDQSFDDYEIIVVDDGSTDNSFSIIDQYSKKHDFIRAFRKKNGGLSSARNYGIKKAHGKYILFVDSDDYISSDMLKSMYERAMDGYDIVVCDMAKVWDNGKEVMLDSSSGIEKDVNTFATHMTMAASKLFKRDLFDDEFKFKEKILYEDLEFIPSLIIKTNKIAYVSGPKYYYYQRDTSIMNQKFNEKFLDIFEVLDSLKNRFITNKKDKEYKEELEYLYIEHLLYSAALRFILFDRKDLVNKCVDIVKKNYPNWKKNKYFLRKSLKFKLVCKFTFNKHYFLLRVLSKIRG